jgi:hypothetical protein
MVLHTKSGTVRKAAPVIAIAALLAATQLIAAGPLPSITNARAAGHWREASLDDYRNHLISLTALVGACARARDIRNCDPLLVGPDDRVPLSTAPNSERRLVRYGWLRVLFSRAEEPDDPAPKPTASQRTDGQPAPPTTSQFLIAAEKRLAADLAQANAQPAFAPPHALERKTMQQVLAGRDFRDLAQPSATDSVLEKAGNWLNRLFENAARLRATSAWVGRAIVWGFILAVCVGLVFGLLQLERRWRVRLVPDSNGPAAGAASARDWQRWLEDAQRAAGAGLWREAIHFVYWAAISRLESRRLWPADRARTPREYLALVTSEDPRKAGLTQLTGSFERTWYGGRAAGPNDYQHAEELAKALIAGGSAPASAGMSGAAGGGAG